ncbi:37S ribosomal protein S24, mitochondrial [Rhizina undulata]
MAQSFRQALLSAATRRTCVAPRVRGFSAVAARYAEGLRPDIPIEYQSVKNMIPAGPIDEDETMEKEWEFDDISSIAHGELEQHREARHYARIAAYEMPQLTALCKPFVPPTKKQILRFRYTTYMGEKHPAEPKVVMEVATIDLDLNDQQRAKLIKLAGVRYNPETDIIRMSCEMFEQPAQNKRYLSDVLDRLIAEAKDLTESFEDIPFDFRHHKFKKPKPKFPKEWLMTEERRKQLDEARAKEQEE